MKQLNNHELNEINGGINLSGALLNYATKAINAILDLGRALGSAIRRMRSGSLCPL